MNRPRRALSACAHGAARTLVCHDAPIGLRIQRIIEALGCGRPSRAGVSV